jgi:hypothetical protein
MAGNWPAAVGRSPIMLNDWDNAFQRTRRNSSTGSALVRGNGIQMLLTVAFRASSHAAFTPWFAAANDLKRTFTSRMRKILVIGGSNDLYRQCCISSELTGRDDMAWRSACAVEGNSRSDISEIKKRLVMIGHSALISGGRSECKDLGLCESTWTSESVQYL